MPKLHDVGTSQSRANQLTRFYTIATLAFNELKKGVKVP